MRELTQTHTQSVLTVVSELPVDNTVSTLFNINIQYITVSLYLPSYASNYLLLPFMYVVCVCVCMPQQQKQQ